MNKDKLNNNINSKINEDDLFPDHMPSIPLNTKLEQQKEEIRKLADELRKKSAKIEPIIVTENGIVKKVSDLTQQERNQELIRCTASPIYFIETYLTIFDQTQGTAGLIVPFKLFDFQKELINTYLKSLYVVANKYRQAGISTTTCAYIAWYIMFNSNRQVAIVANKLGTARDEIMSDVVSFISDCPDWLRPKVGRETSNNSKYKDTQILKIYDNDSRLGAFSAQGGLRGMTPTLIFWDETAWTDKGDKFWTAAKPTLGTGGGVIMVSTPSGYDSVFYPHYKGAVEKSNNFKAVELWWFNDPRYNQGLSWLKNKGNKNEIRLEDKGWSKEERIKLMNDGWEASSPWFERQIADANGDMKKIAQELLCSFLGSGDNFIAEQYLKRIDEEEVKEPIRKEYLDLNMWIWEDAIPEETYVMTIDASPGHGEDNSTINILKNNELIEEKIIIKNGISKKVKLKRHKVEQVAEYYGKVTPQVLAEIAYQYGKRYNDAYTVVDITGGYGAQAVEKLIEIGYASIHYAEVSHKPSRDRLQGYVKQGQKVMTDGSIVNVDLIPGFFIGNNRASVVLELQRAIHMEDVLIHSSRLYDELKTFVTVPGTRVADHKRSFHDDSIMGLSIGLFVINFDMAKFKQSKSMTEKMLNALLTNNDVNQKTIEAKSKYATPIRTSVNSSTNPYIVHNWLFNGLDKKNK